VSSMELLQDCKNLKDALRVLTEKEKELNRNITTFQSGADVTEFIEAMNMKDKCCAACGRTFVSRVSRVTLLHPTPTPTPTPNTGSMNTKQIRDMQIALSKLRDMLQQDEKREEFEQELEELSDVRGRLEPLRAPFEALDTLETKTLPQAREHQEKKAGVLKKLKSELSDRMEIMEETESKVKHVETFRDDVNALAAASEAKNEAAELLKEQEEQLNLSSSNERTKSDIDVELARVTQKVKKLQQSKVKHRDTQAALREKQHLNTKTLLEYKSQRVELHKCVKELRETVEEIKTLSKRIENASTERATAKTALKRMKKTVTQLESEHRSKKKSLSGSVSKLQKELNLIRSDFHRYVVFEREAREYDSFVLS